MTTTSRGGSGAAAADLDQIRPDLDEAIRRHQVGSDSYRQEATARRHASGRRTARENVADLVDEGSFVEYGALTIAAQRRRRSLGDLIERTPADGLVMGTAAVGGRPVAVMSYDYTVLAGTQGIQNHRKTDRLFELARREHLPVVIFAEGGGGRPGDTDTAAVAQLDVTTFRLLAELSGQVPLVAIVSGYCFAGNAALAAACDVIIATEGSSLGMGGPAMIEGGGLGVVAPGDVGPMSVQVPNGVVDVLVPDDAAAVATARAYLGYVARPPAAAAGPAAGLPGAGAGDEPAHADQRVLRHLVPENRVRAYDVRPVIDALFDRDSVLELRPEFGVGIITALARLDGRPVGVIANNPHHLGGAIDGDAADKATRFLGLCQAHRLADHLAVRHPRVHGRAGGREDRDRAPFRRHVHRRGPADRPAVCRGPAQGLRPRRDGHGRRGPQGTAAVRGLADRGVRRDGAGRGGPAGFPQGTGRDRRPGRPPGAVRAAGRRVLREGQGAQHRGRLRDR